MLTWDPGDSESVSKLNLSDNQDKDLNAKNAKFSAKVAKEGFFASFAFKSCPVTARVEF